MSRYCMRCDNYAIKIPKVENGDPEISYVKFQNIMLINLMFIIIKSMVLPHGSRDICYKLLQSSSSKYVIPKKFNV